MLKKIFLTMLLFFSFAVYFATISTASSTTSITISEGGFSPNNITIPHDTIVVFINKDAKDRWPASNFHPTHDLYPEFDPKKPIAPAKSWTFTLNKVGTWKFHDHLNPHQGGVIVVKQTEDRSLLSRVKTLPVVISILSLPKERNLIPLIQNILAFAPFANIDEKQKKVSIDSTNVFSALNETAQQRALKNMAIANGARSSWKFIVATYSNEQGSTGTIHDLAHFAGQLLYDDEGINGLAMCSPQFAFGCYHGLLDKAFAESLDKLSDAENGCLQAGSEGSGPYASCIHGIGHGIASHYQVRDLPNALGTCEKLKESGRTYCFDGVFMEFARNAPVSFYKRSDPLYPCNTLTEKYQQPCGRNQPPALMQRFRLSFENIAEICVNATSGLFTSGCIDALGFYTVQSSNGNPEQIIKTCREIQDDTYYAACVTAAAGEIVFQALPNWQKTSEEICNALGSEQKTNCFKNRADLIKSYHAS